jgi:alkanesulfonate monooxygenase SsuD/methylene tetrahydromethanopterin reductase-like flavin-dependent oxidoreductase (luciferase family)
VVDKRVDRLEILGDNPLKFAVFGANVSHGCAITSAPGNIEVTWSESVELARAAEDAGIEGLVPVARWRGFGGETNFNHRCFETYTWAAGVAAATEKLVVFSTSHVPTIHPVLAAKQAVTIDHISGGRFVLNIVAGWNSTEIGMFGRPQAEHDVRYHVAAEWIELMKRLWTEEGSFDFDGKYFQCPGAYAEPKPIQSPHPLIMSAGVSPAGREFAARHADILFILAPDFAAAAEIAREVRAQAKGYGRQVMIWAMLCLTVRDTEAEAKKYFDYYVNERGDWDAANNLYNMWAVESDSGDPSEKEQHLRNLVAGYAGFPIVGTPQQVAEQIADCHRSVGLDGVTLSWVDYREGIAQLKEQVMPLLVQAGVRKA